MRFVSKYRKYMINFQVDITEHFATGQSREIQPLLNCEFDRWGSLHPWEIRVALEHWQPNREGGFQGLTVDEDEMTQERPEGRLSVFDTDQFAVAKNLSDERKAELEAFLLARPEHGQDYIVVEAPALVAPWPTWAKTHHSKIAGIAIETGKVEESLVFERATTKRPSVLKALEEATPAVSEDEPLIAA